MSKVLITSIDGATGGAIARHLLECPDYKADVSQVLGFATDEVPKDLKNKGVVIFKLDPSSPEKYIEVFKGVDKVVLIPPSKDNRVEICQGMLEACKEANVKACTLISMAATDVANSESQPHLAQFKKIEEDVKSVIENCAILRANFYAENVLLYTDQIKEGKLPLPVRDGKFAPVAIADVAEAACHLLTYDEKFKKHSGKTITLTGSEALSGSEMAERMSKCLGCTVEFQDISNDEALKILSNIPTLEQSERELLLEFYDLVKENKAEFVSDEPFKKLTGQDPTPLEKFLEIYSNRFLKTA